MKKLAVSMAVVLTASILMSSSAFALLKPKSETKAAPKTSASEKSDDTAKTASVNTVTIMRTNASLGNGSDFSLGVADKNGTESITLENVVATKKEKITVIAIPDSDPRTRETSYKLDATIYEVPAGSKLITTSKPVKGVDNNYMTLYIYKPGTNDATYQTLSNTPSFNIGEVTFGTDDIGYMFQPEIIWQEGIFARRSCEIDTQEHKTPVFIRVVAA